MPKLSHSNYVYNPSGVLNFFKKIDNKKIFVEKDAWILFKYAALSEVVGWTLLVYGIVADRFMLFGSSYALPIGGSIHGMLFLAYLGILLATYSSLGWTRGRALIGIIISVVPYGTLGFELYAAHQRRKVLAQSYRHIRVQAIVRYQDKILVLQPSNSIEWVLPGGDILLGEKAHEALRRILYDVTGVSADVGELFQMQENGSAMELSFLIRNSEDFNGLNLPVLLKRQDLVDEMKFVTAHAPELSESVKTAFKQGTS